MPQYIYNNFTETFENKGKTGYHKMTVNYSAKGESKSKTIMSFANPAIYNLIKTLKGGETLDVEFVKDDKYYNWATAKVVEQEAPSSGGQVDTSPRKVESKSN